MAMSTEQRPDEQQPQGTGEPQGRLAGNQWANMAGEPQAGEPQPDAQSRPSAHAQAAAQPQSQGQQAVSQPRYQAQSQYGSQSQYGWGSQQAAPYSYGQQQTYGQQGPGQQQAYGQQPSSWQGQQNAWSQQAAQPQQFAQSQYGWQSQSQNNWQPQQGSQQYDWQQGSRQGQQADEQQQNGWQAQQDSSWQQAQNAGQIQSPWQSQQQAQSSWQQQSQPQPDAQPQSGWQQPQQQAVWQNQQQNGWQAQSPQAQPQQQSQWRQQQGPQSSGWRQPQSQNAWQQQGAYQQPQPGAQPQSGWQPQQQPQQPAKPVQHHVHHSYIWLNSLQVLVVLLLIGLVAVLPMMAGGLVMGLESGEVVAYALFVGSVILMGVAALAVVVLCYWWSWRHLYYELGDEEFSLYSGIFNKKRVHVPYQRIQSVDQHATLFQRLFGVCTVTIDTAGGAANKAVVVPYLRKSDAEELRRELFARKGYAMARQNAARQPAAGVSGAAGASSASATPGTDSLGQTGNILDVPAGVWDSVRGVFGGDQVQMGRVTFEYGLSNKELIFTGLTNNTAFIAVVLTLIGVIAQVASMFITPYPGYSESLLELAADLGVSLLGDNLVVVLVVAFAVVAVVVWLFSAVGVCINYGGFRARRCDNRIEVERGLLQHRVQGVDVSRVQYVKVRQSVICRLLGYCELSLGKVDAIDTEEESPDPSDEHTIVIHPFVKLSRVPEIIDGLIPEYSDMPVETTRVAPVALRRSIIRDSVLQGTGFWIAVILFVIQLISHLSLGASTVEEEIALLSYIDAGVYVGYIVCAILFAVDVVGAVLWYLDASFACNRRFMQVTNGGFTRETVTFPRVKIQYASTRSNPLQRHAHTATIIARTAAGVGGTTVSLMDVREQDADNWLDWAKPYGNMLH